MQTLLPDSMAPGAGEPPTDRAERAAAGGDAQASVKPQGSTQRERAGGAYLALCWFMCFVRGVVHYADYNSETIS